MYLFFNYFIGNDAQISELSQEIEHLPGQGTEQHEHPEAPQPPLGDTSFPSEGNRFAEC